MILKTLLKKLQGKHFMVVDGGVLTSSSDYIRDTRRRKALDQDAVVRFSKTGNQAYIYLYGIKNKDGKRKLSKAFHLKLIKVEKPKVTKVNYKPVRFNFASP